MKISKELEKYLDSLDSRTLDEKLADDKWYNSQEIVYTENISKPDYYISAEDLNMYRDRYYYS